jgi:hypothetical protein
LRLYDNGCPITTFGHDKEAEMFSMCSYGGFALNRNLNPDHSGKKFRPPNKIKEGFSKHYVFKEVP